MAKNPRPRAEETGFESRCAAPRPHKYVHSCLGLEEISVAVATRGFDDSGGTRYPLGPTGCIPAPTGSALSPRPLSTQFLRAAPIPWRQGLPGRPSVWSQGYPTKQMCRLGLMDKQMARRFFSFKPHCRPLWTAAARSQGVRKLLQRSAHAVTQPQTPSPLVRSNEFPA